MRIGGLRNRSIAGLWSSVAGPWRNARASTQPLTGGRNRTVGTCRTFDWAKLKCPGRGQKIVAL